MYVCVSNTYESEKAKAARPHRSLYRTHRPRPESVLIGRAQAVYHRSDKRHARHGPATQRSRTQDASAVARRHLRRLLYGAGLDTRIDLHCLRHSIATHLLERGMPVGYVRDFLGHKYLESTQVYAG